MRSKITFVAILLLASLNVEANWTSFVLHVSEGTSESVQREATPNGWLDGVCRISVLKWNPSNLHNVFRSWGYALDGCVQGRLSTQVKTVPPSGKASSTTHNWKSFVIHVREGEVEDAIIGGQCKGRDQKGRSRSGGCARWMASLPGAQLDGECWITVPKWNAAHAGIVGTWGHEGGHCIKGSWHE